MGAVGQIASTALAGAGLDKLTGGGVSNIIGEVTGSNAAQRAQAAQQAATGQANQALTGAYNQQQGYLQPYQTAGNEALGALAGNSFMDNWQQDPGYQFRLKQGEAGINNAMASRGLGNSGAALKALTEYNQNLASQEYGNVYNREASRLGQLAGYGQNASNNLASAAGSYGSNLSNNYMGLGNATAAANINQSNQMTNLLGQGLGAGAMLLASDERLKKNMVEIPKAEIEELKRGLRAFYFEYKNELYGGPGRWVGIKAQDLEKTKIGKEIIVEGRNGEKLIDLRKVHSIFLATMAEGEAA